MRITPKGWPAALVRAGPAGRGATQHRSPSRRTSAAVVTTHPTLVYATTRLTTEFAPLHAAPSAAMTVQRSIPDHCFKRNTLKSMQYTIQDLIMAGMLLYCATLIDQPSVPFAAKLVLWPM